MMQRETMKKTALLFTVIALNFMAFPAWAEGEVILDRLTKEQAEELNIVIPKKTPPGFHSLTIEVYDDNGVVKDKEIPFCKNLIGEINWDNKCPDVAKLQTFDQLMKIKVREDLPPYSPAQEPEKTSGLQIAALALLAALAGAKKQDSQSSPNDSESAESSEPQQEELSSIDAGKLTRVDREIGWGDTSKTWQTPFTATTDYFFSSTALYLSHYSPLLARTAADGSYLRAIFGGYCLALLPISFLLGIKALTDTGAQAMAPALLTMLAIVAIAILDAAAGAIAAAIFIVGNLLAGGISSRSEALTVLGVAAIFVAPALLASAIRPLRRLVIDSDGRWERITDYALTTLLTGWIVEKMVNALNGLSGVQLAVTYQARTIAILAATFIFIRMAGEDVATYFYPARMRKVDVELEDPTRRQKVVSSTIRVGFFILLATPYVGLHPQLLIAGVIFTVPLIANFTFGDALPKFEKLHQFLPKATFKLVLLTIVGALLATYLQERITNPTEFLRWCFVVVAIPGLLIAIMEWFSLEPARDWKASKSGRWIYRLGGVAIFFMTIQIVRGVDITSWINN